MTRTRPSRWERILRWLVRKLHPCCSNRICLCCQQFLRLFATSGILLAVIGSVFVVYPYFSDNTDLSQYPGDGVPDRPQLSFESFAPGLYIFLTGFIICIVCLMIWFYKLSVQKYGPNGHRGLPSWAVRSRTGGPSEEDITVIYAPPDYDDLELYPNDAVTVLPPENTDLEDLPEYQSVSDQANHSDLAAPPNNEGLEEAPSYNPDIAVPPNNTDIAVPPNNADIAFPPSYDDLFPSESANSNINVS